MKKDFNYEQLRGILEDLYGEVLFLLEECPGVYYASIRQDETDVFSDEYYIVCKNTEAISSEAKVYGQSVDGQPVESPDSLHELAIYNAEYHPEYFGAYPAPMLTPHGYMVRYRTLDNGIHLLETD